MPYLKLLHNLTRADHNECGDKAAYLGELTRAGFSVPRGFCVTANTYRDVIVQPLHDKIIARIAACEIDDPVDLESAVEEIRAWIENAPLPVTLLDEIRGAINDLNATALAVRASRIVEDVPNPAASGMQQAFLCVAGIDAVVASIRQCWASPWNSRAIYFRHRKKIDQRQVTMAIVVQPMINADAAGVMFTANPMNGSTDEIHIDATWGLGEPVIAARWKPDHFVVAKNDLAIKSRTVASKVVKFVVAADGTLQTISVADSEQSAACQSDQQIIALATLGKQIEAQFKQTQDIEWCRVGDIFWLVQTRPWKKK